MLRYPNRARTKVKAGVKARVETTMIRTEAMQAMIRHTSATIAIKSSLASLRWRSTNALTKVPMSPSPAGSVIGSSQNSSTYRNT